MRKERTIVKETIDWQGITLSVRYCPEYFSCTAHLEVVSEGEKRQPLPITETGYRSHFLPAHEIEEAGGPVAYVLEWLDEAAKSKEWQLYKQQSRQMSLF